MCASFFLLLLRVTQRSGRGGRAASSGAQLQHSFPLSSPLFHSSRRVASRPHAAATAFVAGACIRARPQSRPHQISHLFAPLVTIVFLSPVVVPRAFAARRRQRQLSALRRTRTRLRRNSDATTRRADESPSIASQSHRATVRVPVASRRVADRWSSRVESRARTPLTPREGDSSARFGCILLLL